MTKTINRAMSISTKCIKRFLLHHCDDKKTLKKLQMTQIAVNMLVRHCSCLNVYSNHQWILLHHGVTRWHNLTFVRLSYHKMVQPLFCQALIPQDGITSLCSGSYATIWHNLSLVMLSNNKMAQLTFGQALIWQDGTTSLWLDSYRITSNFTIIHGLFSLNVGLFSSDLKFCACSTHPSHLRVPYLLNRTPSKFFHLLIKRILNPLRVWSVVYQHNSLHNQIQSYWIATFSSDAFNFYIYPQWE